MISFAALNKEDSVGSALSTTYTPRGGTKAPNPTKEAQESAILQLYHGALKKQHEGDLKGAEEIYHDILESGLISPICPCTDECGNTLYRVKFLILKNVASIAKELGDVPRAISAYLEASEYSQDDSTLFYQLALSSASLGDLSLARRSLEQVLHINPRYWSAIQLLCKVLLAVKDYQSCVEVALMAVDINPSFKTAEGLVSHCLSLCPELVSINPLLTKYLFKSLSTDVNKFIEESCELSSKYQAFSGVTVLLETIVPPHGLSSTSLQSLGKFLVSVYGHCKTIAKKQNRPSMGVSVDLYTALDGVKDKNVVESSPVKQITTSQETIPDTATTASETEKRKRRLFSDADIGYQPKRRSTRSKGTVSGSGVRRDYQDSLKLVNKYLPQVYRLVTIPDPMELIDLPIITNKDSLLLRSGNNNTEIVSNVKVLDDISEVKQFIQKGMENKWGIVMLMKNYLWLLASNYNMKWPSSSGVVKVFIECYELVHRHISFPSPFSKLSESEIKEARELYLISLCYCELVLDNQLDNMSDGGHNKKKPNSSHTQFPTPFSDSLIYLQYMSFLIMESETERIVSKLRVLWLKIKMCLLKKDHESAILTIDQCIQVIEETSAIESHDQMSHDQMPHDQPVFIFLPNCSNDDTRVLSIDKLSKDQKHLTQLMSIKNVFTMYEEKKYNDVIDILMPIFKQETGSQSQFFLTLTERDTPSDSDQPSVQLLLESLINVNRIKDAFVCSVQCILEVLSYYTTHGASDSFISALAFDLTLITQCLENNSSVLPQSEYRVIQNVIISMIKVIDILQESADMLVFPDSVYISPWKLLYDLLSCESLPCDDSGVSSSSNTVKESPIPFTDDRKNEQSTEVAAEDSCCHEDNRPDHQQMQEEDTVTPVVMETNDPPNDKLPEIEEEPMEISVVETSQPRPSSPSKPMEVSIQPSQPCPSSPSKPMEGSIEPTQPRPSTPSKLMEGSIEPTQPRPSSPSKPMEGSIEPSQPRPTSPSKPMEVSIEPSQPRPSSLDSNATPSMTTPIKTSSSTSKPALVSSVSPDHSTPPTAGDPPLLPLSDHSSPYRPHPDSHHTPSPLLSFPSSSISSPLVTSRDSPLKSRTVSPLFDSSNSKETSLRFLQQAHSVLGSYGWCTKDNGAFLIFIVTVLHKELRELTALSKELRELLLVELEQCYYCLYGYPYKKAKSRGLVEHHSDQIPLTWERVIVLLEYFHPSYLAAVDETKSTQVTSELITLYKKIIEVVPDHIEPVTSKVSLLEFIDGTLPSLPQSMGEPYQYSSLIGEIYYIIADDSLRAGDNLMAIKYYHSSVMYRPQSFDTWAGLAIALSQRITEDKINQRDLKKKTAAIEKFIEKRTPATIRCFIKAMDLNSSNCYLVEKFGFFLYSIHSFMTQIIKQPLLYKSNHTQDWAGESVKDMLKLADKQFHLALTLEDSKHYEPWIYHFMLGKITKKLNQPSQTVLGHFIKSANILHSEGATYPSLVEVTSKGHAVQAIEVHYHFLSALLKFLLFPSDSISSSDSSTHTKLLTELRNYPLGRITYESLWSWSTDIVRKYREPKGTTPALKNVKETAESAIEHVLSPVNDLSTNVSMSHDDHMISSPPPLVPLSHDDHMTPSTPSPPTSHDDHVIPLPPPPLCSQSFVGFSQLTDDDIAWRDDAFIAPDETSVTIADTVPATDSNTGITNIITGTDIASVTAHTDTSSGTVSVTTTTIADTGTSITSTGAGTSTIGHPIPSHGDATTDYPPSTDQPVADRDHEEQLILVDDSSGGSIASTDSQANDVTSAIELAARDIESIGPDPMSRFSSLIPDPLTEAVYGVAMCSVRFPAYFKPLYRLASVLNTMGYPHEAKKFLLGPIPSCFTEIQEKLVPIFVLKSNIYQNMWQIRIPEINRPGNFPTHARRCLELLFDVLKTTNDLSSLVYVSQQLKAKVEPSKQYMRENVRQSMCIRSLIGCIELLKDISTNLGVDTSINVVKILMDAYCVRNIMVKITELKEDKDRNILKDTEELMMKFFNHQWSLNPQEIQALLPQEKMAATDNVSFDVCVKYCQAKSKH